MEGAQLLDEIVRTLRRFLVLPDGASEALALWIVHTFALEAFQVSPILAVLSPEKRCGKTLLLQILEKLSANALLASSVTSAALFRTVDKFHPTLLIDEADSFLPENEELRGILNSGHHRRSARVIRTVPPSFEVREFSTWAAKSIAMIGRLSATLEDRAIVVRMRRRAPSEPVERARRRALESFEPLRRMAARWAKDHLPELEAADPQVPAALDDRAANNWESLQAIADLAGQGWHERAVDAALRLSGSGREDDNSAGIRLLADLRELFTERGPGALSTTEILEALTAHEDRAWAEWKSGRGLSAVQLAAMLRPFDIAPRTVRRGGETLKGYELCWFSDAFARYLPAEPSHPSQPAIDAVGSPLESRHTEPGVTALGAEESPHESRGVTGVTAGGQGSDPRAPLCTPSRSGLTPAAGKGPAPGRQPSHFRLSDEWAALLESYGWEPLGVEPPEGIGHA